jgi:hypothetical protein
MFGNTRPFRLFVFAMAAVSLTNCSRQKRIGRDELRSDIRSARSQAAESEMFLDFVLQGRSTRSYAAEHSAYLEDEVERSLRELGQAVPEPGVEDAFRRLQNNLRMLAGQLSTVHAATGERDEHALVAAKEAIKRIRESVEATNS